MNEEWITTEEAGEIVGVTRAHIRYLIKNLKLEAKRFGRSWMVKRESAEAYSKLERKTGPKPQENA